MALKVADAVSLGIVVVLGVDEGYQFPEMTDHHRCPPHQLLAVMFCG